MHKIALIIWKSHREMVACRHHGLIPKGTSLAYWDDCIRELEDVFRQILHDLFGRCVCCGIPYEHLHGERATKDHIVPLIAEGCDCIANLQPVCRNCNSSVDIQEDMRERALKGWCAQFIARATGEHFG